MHELGIVFHIQRDLEEVARANAVGHIASVTLELGEVSGVVPELLLDAWRWSADKKELFKGAELLIETIPALTHCEACGEDYATVEHGKTCPHCGSANTYLLQGQEVSIKEIEATELQEDEAVPAQSEPNDAVESANPLHIA